MKIKTLSLTTLFGFLGLFLLIHTFNAKAASNSIVCTTAFGEKSLTIEDQKVSFHQEDESGVSRSISSVNESSVSTLKKFQGFVKTLYVDGKKHKISVQNVNSFSDANDSLTITSPKGHVITYPLSCQSV